MQTGKERNISLAETQRKVLTVRALQKELIGQINSFFNIHTGASFVIARRGMNIKDVV